MVLLLVDFSTCILVSGFFKQPRTFVIVSDILIKFSKTGNVFSSNVVYNVGIG